MQIEELLTFCVPNTMVTLTLKYAFKDWPAEKDAHLIVDLMSGGQLYSLQRRDSAEDVETLYQVNDEFVWEIAPNVELDSLTDNFQLRFDQGALKLQPARFDVDTQQWVPHGAAIAIGQYADALELKFLASWRGHVVAYPQATDASDWVVIHHHDKLGPVSVHQDMSFTNTLS